MGGQAEIVARVLGWLDQARALALGWLTSPAAWSQLALLVVAWLALRQGGPDLWTGAAFGPEAGLLGLLAMFLGILMTAGWLRLRGQPLAVKTRLAEYPIPTIHAPKGDEFEEKLGNINHLT